MNVVVIAFIILAVISLTSEPGFSKPGGQEFEVSYTVTCRLDLDTGLMRSWVDISLKLNDSVPRQSVQLIRDMGLLVDSVLVDGVHLDTASVRQRLNKFQCYDMIVPLSPPIVAGQSRTVSISCHKAVNAKDFKKDLLVLGGSFPLLARSKRGDSAITADSIQLCEANVDYRLTATPPTLAVGAGEMINEAEFILASSKPRAVVLSDLIPPGRFGKEAADDPKDSQRDRAIFLWRAESCRRFEPVLLKKYTLDRTWILQTQVDLYYPEKSKKRWANWAVPVIADVVNSQREKRNGGAYPVRFIVGNTPVTASELSMLFLPDKKFDTARLREAVETALQARPGNFVN